MIATIAAIAKKKSSAIVAIIWKLFQRSQRSQRSHGNQPLPDPCQLIEGPRFCGVRRQNHWEQGN